MKKYPSHDSLCLSTKADLLSIIKVEWLLQSQQKQLKKEKERGVGTVNILHMFKMKNVIGLWK
jgi:hypothetical protein